MKTINLILVAGLAGGLVFGPAALAADEPATNNPAAPADTTNAPPAESTPSPGTPSASADQTTTTNGVTPPDDQASTVVDTNTVVDPATGELKLRMQFRNTPLETVLHYISQAAGYTILEKTDVSGKVTVWSEHPLNKEDALDLVKKMLDENGYTIIKDGPTLTIYTRDSAKHLGIPVILGNIPTNIPINTEIVTQIIPVRSLNAVALLKDLQPLLPTDTTLTANESGNALVMTDTQANIHRIAEIVRALDSVSSSSSTIIVFPLKFADAKSVASLIKDLFPSATTSTGNTPGGGFGNPFGRFLRGGGPGGDGGGGAPASDTGTGHTPSSRVAAVSDDHANALVVSAPDDLIPTIKELVASIDTDVEDTTIVRVFSLKNADATEMATLLSNLFPDDTKTDDNANQFNRARFGFFGAPQQQTAASNSSDRVKRLNRVLAVPDPRTGSLVVSASKDLMPQIATMVERLDENPRRRQQVYVVDLQNAETTDVLPVLQDLFHSTTTSSSSSANSPQNSALFQRGQTIQSQANSTAASFGSSSTSGGARAPGQ